jgi:hypothetical protein
LEGFNVLVEVIAGFHIVGIFVKFPLIDKANLQLLALTIVLILALTVLEDPDLIGIRSFFMCPPFALYMILVAAILVLKVYFRFLIR